MTILYIGDIVGSPGIEVVGKVLPDIRKDQTVDLVIAQAENTTAGKGLSLDDYERLLELGIDFLTGGNWMLANDQIYEKLTDPSSPVIRPANYPADTPGLGHKLITKNGQTVLVFGLLGKVVGKDSTLKLANPLEVADRLLNDYQLKEVDAAVVNFHGDYSSEKVIIGHYLDGRVSAVVGDHWHVPTADARVLPGGTAHISDVGMCGALDSSLGVSYSSVIPRWKDNQQTKNRLEHSGQRQFNAVFVETIDRRSASSIKLIQRYF